MPVINTTITETTNITENGLHDVAKYTTANVDVQPNLEELEVTPSTSSQTFTPTTDGYSSVSVDAVDSSIDNNIIPENIKKDIIILGVTGTHEGGITNPEEYMFVSFTSTYDSSQVNHFVKKSEWDNLSIGDEVKVYDIFGNQITGNFNPNPYMAYTYTTPFILQSKGKFGILDTATILSANNKTESLKILRTENCYTIYSSYLEYDNPIYVVGPLYPKIGDEILQYSDIAPFQIEIPSILTTGQKLSGYSTSNPLMYYPTRPTSDQKLTAYGPITIKDMKIESGRTSLILQDKDGNILTNEWHMAIPEGYISITENHTDTYAPYYSNVHVDISMPPATGGGYIPLAITDYEGNTYVRRFNTGSAKDFYAWENESDGTTYYTYPLNNLSTLTSGSDMFSDWALQNSIGLIPNNIYAGGIRTENGTIAYISDLCEGELRIKNSEGIEIGFPEYKLPEVGEYAGPWGMVEEVYDSTIPMPIAIYGSSVGWLFFNRLDGDDYEPLMIFNNNHGMEYSVCGSKFYGIGNYSICDEMGWSQEDMIEQYSFLGIVVDGEKYVKVNTSPIGNAVEFTNGQDSVYLDANNMLDTGVDVFEDDSLSTQIGYVDEVLSSQ